MLFGKVTLIGVGLLGGSLGMAMRQRKLASKVAGYVRREASIAECLNAGAVDEATVDLAHAVQDADLIVLCTPLAQMGSLARQIKPFLRKGAIVTDVGSVKESVMQEVEPAIAPAAFFVGSHPMAGAEKMGVSSARADLFQNSVCVVTPSATVDRGIVDRVTGLWTSVGARVLEMTPALHDELVSRSSHLPHLVAAELARFVLGPEHPPEQRQLCANGFRDATRIAAGSPEMWRDITLANRENLLNGLDQFIANLQQLRATLDRKDVDAIAEFFTTAKERRDAWSAKAASPSPE